MSKVLIVDDEKSVRVAFASVLKEQGYEVVAVDNAEAAIAAVGQQDCDVAVLDIRLPGMNGLDALARILELRPKLPVIVMTGQGTSQTAIEATKRGAFDYHVKPFEPDAMLQTIAKAVEAARLMKGYVALEPQRDSESEAIVGRSPEMQQVYKAIGRVAPTDATVLIRGESGSGKELVARAIYHHSKRSAMPLLAVSCAAIPDTLLESELFGYEPGAFTGAVMRRIGKFEQADGGTLFLDEIGDISPAIQTKILRLVQEKSFQRLGGNATVHADVRLICATNRNLEKAIADGGFRDDLYHRLNVVTIHLPPLRDRRGDIPLLIEYFLNRFSRELQIPPPPVAADALEMLTRHSWTGNVRELEHVIHRALIFTRGYSVHAADLPLTPEPGQASSAEPFAEGDQTWLPLIRAYMKSQAGNRVHEHLLEHVERLLLSEAMRHTRGNQTHAASLLGLARPTLHAKLQKYGLHGPFAPPEPSQP